MNLYIKIVISLLEVFMKIKFIFFLLFIALFGTFLIGCNSANAENTTTTITTQEVTNPTTTTNIMTTNRAFEINFDSNGGDQVNIITAFPGANITLPEPIKAGYTFAGWYQDASLTTIFTSATMPGEDLTLYAKWQAVTYDINYVLNAGKNGNNPDTYTYTIETANILLNSPTKTGYAFAGWYDNTDFTGDAITLIPTGSTGDITLYAKWQIETYDINYVLNSGINGDNPNTYTIETANIPLDAPTKTGYAFAGWYDNLSFTGDAISQIPTGSTGDITLYAKWTINQYYITYNIYDEYDPLSDIPLYKDETITSISSGLSHSGALTSNGRIFTWGSNQNGQLGDGTTNDSYIPVDISSQFALSGNEKVVTLLIGDMKDSLALTSDGRVFSWGYNTFGQLGDVNPENGDIPTDITAQFDLNNDEKIISIALGFDHSAALTSEGRLFMFGTNFNGQLGNGTTTDSRTPIDITSQFGLYPGEEIIKVSLGDQHSAALTSLGRVFTWGINTDGELGDGTTTDSHTPVDITAKFDIGQGESISEISMGGPQSAAITSLGRLFTWGNNLYGQLGDGTLVNKSIPTNITGEFSLATGETITNFLFAEKNSLAVTSLGRIFTAGDNFYYQLGDGTNVSKQIPQEITSQFSLGQDETVSSISIGGHNMGLITSSARVFTWGDNSSGQLADGTTNNRNKPSALHIINPVITSTNAFDYGDSVQAFSPTRQGYSLDSWYEDTGLATPYVFTTMPAENFKLIGVWKVNQYTVSFDSNGGSAVDPITQDYDTVLTEPSQPTKTGNTFAGWYSDAGLTTPYAFTTVPAEDVTLYAKWSVNQYTISFNTGLGASPVSPITQDYGTTVTEPLHPNRTGYTFNGWSTKADLTDDYTFSTMPAQDLTLYAKWKINTYDINYHTYNNYDPGNSILLAEGEQIVSQFSGNVFKGVLTSDGRVFTWGSNWYGDLGDGTATASAIPIDITPKFNLNQGETITAIFIGPFNGAAITSDGRVFTWGHNQYGEIGDGTTIDKTSPVDITANFNLNPGEVITSIAFGYSHAAALTSDDRIFMWGYNGFGQLGDGTISERDVPVDVTSHFPLAAGETISSISLGYYFSLANTSTGRLLAWGHNDYGQLGNSDYTDLHTPTDVTSFFGLAAGETITSISAGGTHAAAITSANRFFTWGSNDYGEQGTGTYPAGSNIPVEITSEFGLNVGETFASLSLGANISSTITSDNRVFTWGWNFNGNLGNGTTNTTTLSEPTPIDITANFILDSDEHVVSLSMCSQDASAITSKGRMFTWGLNNFGQLGDGTKVSSSLPISTIFATVQNTRTDNFDYDANISVYNPTRPDYTFGGWYSDILLTQAYTFPTTMPASDITLYAKWIPNTTIIRFESNGGSDIDPIMQAVGSTFVMPADPTKDNYDFVGWYYDKDLTVPFDNDLTMPNSNMILYAKWVLTP